MMATCTNALDLLYLTWACGTLYGLNYVKVKRLKTV